ncbi:transcriptional regulator NanR [Polymorphobacter fuscus]|uniref:Transcriptional regulator NanR n=1 Tax=Sandarakinorhabdus fusca TaxID=1439888 RepID=A0A7C9GRZ9_9SPHN|nr:transcriptional regulator NanR [Polymorphobacter fuscus]KAB7646290.1 transcriptional regulator NanR [Polymorphobacter fuscus]MQT17511.1 transcriptional regulator NanR [Polymorphobacter fuscus]NJC09950.1 DNA-binding FadR family transcriptional regulator [Polymorphobacter fuscus]
MSAEAQEPIVRRKLSDEVFDRLKAMIVSGEVAPGAALPSERELMVRFGVGRPAIREAMQALANMGLVTINHGERARVRRLTAGSAMRQLDPIAQLLLSVSPESLEHLKDARLFFERGMVRRAAELATPADIADLRALCARQGELAGDSTAFMGADMDLHTRIAAISGNPIYVTVSQMMLGWLREYHAHMLIWQGHSERTLAEHAEVIDHIEAHNPDGAEQALVRHLTRSNHLYAHREGAKPTKGGILPLS